MYQQHSQQLAEQAAVRCAIGPLDLDVENKTLEDGPPDDSAGRLSSPDSEEGLIQKRA